MQKPHELHLSSFSSTTLVDFSLCFLLLVDFLQCTLHSQLPTQFYESQAASCKHSHGQIDAVGPLKRVTTSIFKTNKSCHRSKQKLILIFWSKCFKNLKNQHRIYKKNWIDFLYLKNINLMILSF
jgi:hypothetical protein